MSKKQDRLNETISLIHKAIQSCGGDFATINIRANLLSALREAGHVSTKRDRRENNAMHNAIQKATKINDEWWKRIEENVRKAVQKEKEGNGKNIESEEPL